jgi:hypothetical protein
MTLFPGHARSRPDRTEREKEAGNDLDPLVSIEPLPSYVWYRDMADFAEGITDERAGRRLARAIDGKGAFRRFRNEHPDPQLP